MSIASIRRTYWLFAPVFIYWTTVEKRAALKVSENMELRAVMLTSSTNISCISSHRFFSTVFKLNMGPVARFSKAFETFRARKFLVGFYLKRTSVHVKNMQEAIFSWNMWMQQLCNNNVWDFAAAFRVRKHFGTFEKLTSVTESRKSLVSLKCLWSENFFRHNFKI